MAEKRSRARILLLVAVSLGIFIGFCVFGTLIVELWPDGGYSSARRVEYEGFSLDEDRGTVQWLEFHTRRLADRKVPKLYIRFADRPTEAYFLPDLSEDVVRARSVSQWTYEWLDGTTSVHYTLDGDNDFEFRANRLTGMTIVDPHVEVSSKRDGVFIKFPTSLRKVLQVFGKPHKYVRLKEPPV